MVREALFIFTFAKTNIVRTRFPEMLFFKNDT